MSKRKPKKSTIKRKCDSVFSKIVRIKGICERCGKTQMSARLENAHINSRRFTNTRWDKDNCVCLCSACHRWGHNYPVLFSKFVERIKGKETISYINKRSQEVKKMTTFDYQCLLQKLEEELKELQYE